MATIAIFATRAKYKSAMKDLKRLGKGLNGKAEDLSPTARNLAIYIVISLSLTGAMVFLSLMGIAYYLGLPFISNIDAKTLSFLSVGLLLITTIVSIVLALAFQHIFNKL
jgi:hypothetical protein